MIYTHHSARKITVPMSKTQRGSGYKPDGLWVSWDGPMSWESWSKGDKYCLEDLAFRHDVEVHAHKLIWLRNTKDIKQFTDKHGHRRLGSEDTYDYGMDIRIIDWSAVASLYSGIMIFPYNETIRLDLMWYYGWDCASGCIWDSAAIRSLTVVKEARKRRVTSAKESDRKSA